MTPGETSPTAEIIFPPPVGLADIPFSEMPTVVPQLEAQRETLEEWRESRCQQMGLDATSSWQAISSEAQALQPPDIEHSLSGASVGRLQEVLLGRSGIEPNQTAEEGGHATQGYWDGYATTELTAASDQAESPVRHDQVSLLSLALRFAPQLGEYRHMPLGTIADVPVTVGDVMNPEFVARLDEGQIMALQHGMDQTHILTEAQVAERKAILLLDTLGIDAGTTTASYAHLFYKAFMHGLGPTIEHDEARLAAMVDAYENNEIRRREYAICLEHIPSITRDWTEDDRYVVVEHGPDVPQWLIDTLPTSEFPDRAAAETDWQMIARGIQEIPEYSTELEAARTKSRQALIGAAGRVPV